MEDCGSVSLFQRYTRRRANEAEVRFFLKQMVAGQLALHRAHIYQVDVKMTNMMVTDTGVLKLIDFGFARRTDESTLGRIGADGYYIPEMLLDQTYRPSMIDTWNDGICIYKMLYGVYCFGSRSLIYQCSSMMTTDRIFETSDTLFQNILEYPIA
jgi:serine/threonine protein kinase